MRIQRCCQHQLVISLLPVNLPLHSWVSLAVWRILVCTLHRT